MYWYLYTYIYIYIFAKYKFAVYTYGEYVCGGDLFANLLIALWYVLVDVPHDAFARYDCACSSDNLIDVLHVEQLL